MENEESQFRAKTLQQKLNTELDDLVEDGKSDESQSRHRETSRTRRAAEIEGARATDQGVVRARTKSAARGSGARGRISTSG